MSSKKFFSDSKGFPPILSLESSVFSILFGDSFLDFNFNFTFLAPIQAVLWVFMKQD